MLKQAEADGQVTLNDVSDLALEDDCQRPLNPDDDLVPALRISRDEEDGLVLTADPDMPMAVYSVKQNIAVPMEINKIAALTPEQFPGVQAFNDLLKHGPVGAAAHIAWSQVNWNANDAVRHHKHSYACSNC